MKNLTALLGLMLMSSTVFANNSKLGTVILSGNSQKVVIQEHSANGTITIGNQSFKVMSGGSQSVEGVAKETVNGEVTKDLNIIIKFQALSADDIKQAVDNKNDTECTEKSNSTIFIFDNLSGSLVGNCSTLTDN